MTVIQGTMDKQGTDLNEIRNTLNIISQQLKMRAAIPSDQWKAGHIKVSEGNAYLVMQALADKVTDPEAGISVRKVQEQKTKVKLLLRGQTVMGN
jgi:hypothetical protein